MNPNTEPPTERQDHTLALFAEVQRQQREEVQQIEEAISDKICDIALREREAAR